MTTLVDSMFTQVANMIRLIDCMTKQVEKELDKYTRIARQVE